jgi:hypothetical protein
MVLSVILFLSVTYVLGGICGVLSTVFLKQQGYRVTRAMALTAGIPLFNLVYLGVLVLLAVVKVHAHPNKRYR